MVGSGYQPHDDPPHPTPHPTRHRRGRSRWVDPLLLGLVAMLAYVAHGFEGMLTRDTGVYAYAGQEVARGVLPYLEIWNRDGPVAHVVPALGAWLAPFLGVPTVLAQRVEFALISAAVVMSSTVLARRHLGTRSAGVVAGAAVLSFQAVAVYATAGPREKTAMVLFIVGALLAAHAARWLLAGVLVALATLTIQTGLFAVLPAVVALAMIRPRCARTRAVLAVGLGGLAALGLVVGAYALVGHLDALVDAFLVLNTEYTSGTPITERWTGSWRTMRAGFGPSLAAFLLGLTAAVLLPVLELARPRERRTLPATAWAYAAATVSGTGWTMLDYDSWPDALSLVPLSAIGVASLFSVVLDVVRRSVGRRRATTLAAVATAGLVAASILGVGSFAVGHRTGGLERQQASVDAVLDVLPRAEIASIDAPQALVLGGRRGVSRHQIFAAAMVKDLQARVPGGLPGYFRWLRRVERPELVAVGTKHRTGLERRLRQRYVLVGDAPLWRWWARADLGAETVDALRRAAAPASTPRFRDRLATGDLARVYCPTACPGADARSPRVVALFLPPRIVRPGVLLEPRPIRREGRREAAPTGG